MKIGKYELMEKIGQGKFGQVFKGKNVKTGEWVAIKLEKTSEINILKHETTILNYLYSKSCRNIPPVYLYGKIENYSYLIMQFYNKPMDAYMDYKPLLRSAILILKNIHEHNVLHRDIKPENWMIRENEMVLIDFGLATFYIDDSPVAKSERSHVIGTPKYVSIYIHDGCGYRYRDDLISLVYIGLGLIKGSFDELWGSIPVFTSEVYDKTDILHPMNRYLFEKKRLDNIRKLVVGHTQFTKYVEMVYSLRPEDRPDYHTLADLFCCDS